MNINVTGKHLDMSPVLTDYTQKALQELAGKYTLNPIECQVIFSKLPVLFKSEISLHLEKDNYLRIEEEAETAYLSFDHALKNLETKIRKYKERIVHHTRHHDHHITDSNKFNDFPSKE